MEILLALVISLSAHADIGPKPELFIQLDFDLGAQAKDAALLQCKEESCKDAAPLGAIGPQGFHCCRNACYGLAYGFSPLSKLRIQWKGKELLSNSIKTEGMGGDFTATIEGGKLVLSAMKTPLDDSLRMRIRQCTAPDNPAPGKVNYKEVKEENAETFNLLSDKAKNVGAIITSAPPCHQNSDCVVACKKGETFAGCRSGAEVDSRPVKSNAGGAVQKEIPQVCLSDAYAWPIASCRCLPQARKCGVMSDDYIHSREGLLE